jgi:hypothetical protein
LLAKSFWHWQRSSTRARQQMSQGWLVEAPNPHWMVPTSTIYTYKVFNSIHMLWMGRWIHHHATLTILVG